MERKYFLKCTSCAYETEDEKMQDCPNCHGLFEIEYDTLPLIEKRPDRLDLISRMWQFKDFLPVNANEHIVTLGEGSSPLVWGESDRNSISQVTGYKLDYVNPTCSFKDRGASLLLTKAKNANATSVVIDSSGNAAAAVAAYSSRANIACYVFVPAYTSVDKIEQIKSYGAEVKKIDGTRQQVLESARDFAKRTGGYYCGFQLNPFAAEATATVAFEIAVQTNWNPPDQILLPMGTGGLLIGCAKGFLRLHELGWISRIPKLIGVQPEGCSPISYAFHSQEPITPLDNPVTIAEGLKIGNPYKGNLALAEIRRTGGDALIVSDEEIKDAVMFLAKQNGIYSEPSGAVSTAGFLKIAKSGYFSAEERIVCVVTGSGLKTGASTQ